jgi:hypothetical protein
MLYVHNLFLECYFVFITDTQLLILYSTFHPCHQALRMFVVAMKSSENRKYWYENSAEKSLKIHQQVRRTYSGSPALKYFDSSTMQKYQIPHKSIETLYCQSYPELCGSLDFENDRKEENVPISDLEVGMSTIGEGSGRGVFARVDIKKGSILALQETIHPVYCSPGSMKLVYDYSEMQETKYVFNYLDGYGWLTSALVSLDIFISFSMYQKMLNFATTVEWY